jgi:segregation and condensation protein A
MEKLVYKLEAFEGPLDVLLYLISKNKLNIYDIPIAELLDQYLGYLHSMQEMDMEVTSEFLSMASRLVQIKSSRCCCPAARTKRTTRAES